MAWSDPSANLVFATGEVVTAAKMNLISADLTDLDRRTTVTGAIVATTETTASAAFVALATAGPAVTVSIGAVGQCLSDIYSSLANTATTGPIAMGFSISGATTVAAVDAFAISLTPPAIGTGGRQGASFYISALTPGSNTFTAKYRAVSGTASFTDRKIFVTPLGS